ncbi:50S ribosomal protein L18Ae [Methanococcus voltae]|uniref:Large ribosomal subunit protein eL20 n=1 Tax=Methanococcus voltae (strain ATCC BAA-1334 / A3) TaxID=456320 RepID=D7DV68_METV3|nr:50S ribosomal protein L18Ae [Methanococcus voltae]MCS3901929.1 large subunit ribosomal protein LX [Methanococcus voltae]
MAKIIKINGEILGKDEPMVFSKEYNVLKEEDALEIMYSEIGSKHHVKRAFIKINSIEEVSLEDIKNHSLKKFIEMN